MLLQPSWGFGIYKSHENHSTTFCRELLSVFNSLQNLLESQQTCSLRAWRDHPLTEKLATRVPPLRCALGLARVDGVDLRGVLVLAEARKLVVGGRLARAFRLDLVASAWSATRLWHVRWTGISDRVERHICTSHNVV